MQTQHASRVMKRRASITSEHDLHHAPTPGIALGVVGGGAAVLLANHPKRRRTIGTAPTSSTSQRNHAVALVEAARSGSIEVIRQLLAELEASMSSEDKAAVLERSGSSASQPGTAPSSSSSLQSGAHGGSMLGGGAASSAAAASSASSPMSSMMSGSNALSSSTAGSPKPWNINELVAGCTALHHAVFYNHLPIVELLVEHRADTNMKNLSGYTPLHWAVERKHTSIIKYLLEWGVDPDIADPHGMPALHKALALCSASSPDAPMPNLPAPGATSLSASASTSSGGGASNDAAESEFGVQVARWLIETGGASIDLLSGKPGDEQRLAPIHIAAAQGSLPALELLVSQGANLSLTTPKGATALHRAVCKGHVAAVRFLCRFAIPSEQTADALSRADARSTPMSLSEQRLAATRQREKREKAAAAASGANSAARMEIGIDEADSNKRTALHWAAFYHNLACVKALIDAKASLRIVDSTQATPLTLALRKVGAPNHDELIALLAPPTGSSSSSTSSSASVEKPEPDDEHE